MSSINELSQVSAVSASDQFVLYNTVNGQPRRASAQEIADFVADNLDPDTMLPNGVLDISSIFQRRTTVATPQVLTTALALLSGLAGQIVMPSTGSAVSMDPSGHFISTRDIAAGLVSFNMQAFWPATRILTAQILVGPDATPFTLPAQYIEIGNGAAVNKNVNISGLCYNGNNVGNKIAAGDKIKLMVKFDTGDTLTINNASFTFQSLDGA